ARVRVLIQDPARAIRTGHGLVTIGRRLTSYIAFRNVREESRGNPAAYVIADDTNLLYRPQATSCEGVCELHAPHAAQPALAAFDQLWQACGPRTSRVLRV